MGTLWLAADLGASAWGGGSFGELILIKALGAPPTHSPYTAEGSQCPWEAGLEHPSSKVLSSSAVGFNPVQGHTHPAADALNLHSFLFSPKRP